MEDGGLLLRLVVVKLCDLDDWRRDAERRATPAGRGAGRLDVTPVTDRERERLGREGASERWRERDREGAIFGSRQAGGGGDLLHRSARWTEQRLHFWFQTDVQHGGRWRDVRNSEPSLHLAQLSTGWRCSCCRTLPLSRQRQTLRL